MEFFKVIYITLKGDVFSDKKGYNLKKGYARTTQEKEEYIMKTLNFIGLYLVFTILMGTEMLYADFVTDKWTIETVDNTTSTKVGEFNDIAFRPGTSEPYISYYDGVHYDLYLAYKTNTGAWAHFVVDDNSDVGSYSSIAYYKDDTNETIYISYFDARQGALKLATIHYYATLGMYQKSSQYLDYNSSDGRHSGLYSSVLLNHGEPQVVYGSDDLGLANGDQIRISKNGTSEALYEGNNIHIKTSAIIDPKYYNGWYTFYDANHGGSLKIRETTTPPSLQNHVASFDENATSAALAYNEQRSMLQLAYYNFDTGKLRFAIQNPHPPAGNCGITTQGMGFYDCMDIATIGTNSSQHYANIAMVLDGAGRPVIAYQDASDDQSPPTLNIARPIEAYGISSGNCGPQVNAVYQWQCSVIDDGTQNGGGGHLYEADHLSMAISDNGLIMIAYSEYDDYYNKTKLKVAYIQDLSKAIILPSIYYLLQ